MCFKQSRCVAVGTETIYSKSDCGKVSVAVPDPNPDTRSIIVAQKVVISYYVFFLLLSFHLMSDPGQNPETDPEPDLECIPVPVVALRQKVPAHAVPQH